MVEDGGVLQAKSGLKNATDELKNNGADRARGPPRSLNLIDYFTLA
jgi:hypothetical protein